MRILFFFLFSLSASATPLPDAPTSPEHPGSKIYSYSVARKDLRCNGRTVNVIYPSEPGKYPVVVYGHGQALGLDAYLKTFEHLAKKGVATVFPMYDSGFFDQEWRRMGEDYVALTKCATQQVASLDSEKLVFSGHSKGAYVASIAAGLAGAASAAPKAVVLFAPAGADPGTLGRMDPNLALTVIYSDRDAIVSEKDSETIFQRSAAKKRQYILVKSYSETTPQLFADHFWPLTEKTFFGGAEEGALHYHGAWKWLGAAALDLTDEVFFDDPYLYGDKAVEKGIAQIQDEVRRSW